MNDVMKKRLIGVVILVAIGIAVPVLLSKCMGGGAKNGDDQTRVYNVEPNGDSSRADAQDDSDSTADSDDADQGNDDSSQSMPAAVSPQSETSDRTASDSDDDAGFDTPPVHGNGASKSSSTSTDRGSSSSNASRSSSSSDRSSSASSRSASGSRSSGASSRSSGGHDYGASTQGRSSGTSSSSASSASSGGGLQRSSISGWVVQVGSFTREDNAQDLARRLSGNFSASFTPGQVSGRTYYRVNVGPFSSESAARSAAAQIKQQGHPALVRNLP